MTRKRILDTNKQLAEYLESSEEVFCVYTKDVLEAVIQDSAAAYNETRRLIQESNEKYSASLDTLTNTLREILDNHHRNSQASSTVSIVYQVIETIKSKPSTNQQSPEINIENKKIAKRIVRIVSIHREERLQKHNDHLFQRDHPEKSINVTFTKMLSGNKIREATNHELLVFTHTYNPSMLFNKKTITKLIDDVNGEYTKKAFSKSRIVVGTRQPPSLRNMLVTSKLSTKVSEEKKKTAGLFTCRGCIDHLKDYVKRCTFCKFGKRDKFSWNYTSLFNCDIENVIYILICRTCWMLNIGETKRLNPRTRKHRSDVLHPNNTCCKKLTAHLRKCSKMKGPYFRICPVIYVADQSR